MSDAPVLAYDRYPTNAELIAAAASLGHLRREWVTLDPTYDKGVFWKKFRPEKLVASDVRPRRPEVERVDFRRMPWADDTFDAVAFDPPYGLRGTVNKTNGGYGLDAGYLSIVARHVMIRQGISECARVTRTGSKKTGGRVLVKCQDQVCSGRMWWQTRIFADHAETVGLELVDRLDMECARDQPERTRWACHACGKGTGPGDSSAGPRHRCRKVDAWLAAERPDHPTGMYRRPDGTFAEDAMGSPWLFEVPSPQEHARNRPSSLLVFVKTGELPR